MITKSLKLNLKLVYQLTHRMMICPSKCRPLNNASTGQKGCILPSSPDRGLFAPERLGSYESLIADSRNQKSSENSSRKPSASCCSKHFVETSSVEGNYS